MKLITISGLDGSGKSTQVELLKAYLEGQGKKVFYFHAIEFGLANKLFGSKKAGEAKSVTQANGWQIFLRRIFLLIDISRYKSLVKDLGKQSLDYIVSDRYFYDSVINIEYLASRGNPKTEFSDYLKLGFRITPPDVAVYLNADPAQIMQRERQPDQGLEYLQKKKEIYDKKAVLWGWQKIDGNRGKEEIFEEIKKYV